MNFCWFVSCFLRYPQKQDKNSEIIVCCQKMVVTCFAPKIEQNWFHSCHGQTNLNEVRIILSKIATINHFLNSWNHFWISKSKEFMCYLWLLCTTIRSFLELFCYSFLKNIGDKINPTMVWEWEHQHQPPGY